MRMRYTADIIDLFTELGISSRGNEVDQVRKINLEITFSDIQGPLPEGLIAAMRYLSFGTGLERLEEGEITISFYKFLFGMKRSWVNYPLQSLYSGLEHKFRRINIEIGRKEIDIEKLKRYSGNKILNYRENLELSSGELTWIMKGVLEDSILFWGYSDYYKGMVKELFSFLLSEIDKMRL